MNKIVTRDAWKALPAVERAKAGVRQFVTSAKAKLTPEKAKALGIEFKPQSYLWTLSGDVKDRYRDIIRVPGWQTDNYKQAGSVVQWAHDTRSLPIGTMLTTWKETGLAQGHNRLRGVRHFHGQTQLSKEVASLVELDILRASSVGFMPIEMRDLVDDKGMFEGFDFISQDLLEDSVVPVPANPEAIVGAKSVAGDFPSYREELERAIAEGLYESDGKDRMKRAYTLLGTERTYHTSPGTEEGQTANSPEQAPAAAPDLATVTASLAELAGAIRELVEAQKASQPASTHTTVTPNPPSSDEATARISFAGF